MRFVPLLLAVSTLALLSHCSGGPIHAKRKAPVLTGITEYYHPGSTPLSSPSITPLPATPVKSRRWALFTAPSATRPPVPSPGATSAGNPSSPVTNPPKARVRLLSLIHVSSPALLPASSTHPPTFANSDGTTSKVIGNALIRSDGTSATMIGNTVFHPDGTTSRIVGNTLINADGSRSSRIKDNP